MTLDFGSQLYSLKSIFLLPLWCALDTSCRFEYALDIPVHHEMSRICHTAANQPIPSREGQTKNEVIGIFSKKLVLFLAHRACHFATGRIVCRKRHILLVPLSQKFFVKTPNNVETTSYAHNLTFRRNTLLVLLKSNQSASVRGWPIFSNGRSRYFEKLGGGNSKFGINWHKLA